MKVGEEVIVVTREAREVAKIVYIGPAVVELDDGRLYFLDDGKGLHDNSYIVPEAEQPVCQ